jgi:polysaccharide export outer membrane protein
MHFIKMDKRVAGRWIAGAVVLLACSSLQVVYAQNKPPASAAQAPAAGRAHGYVIGPGDVLQITVAKEPDASVGSVVVRSDGIVSIPLIKEIAAAGLTPHELERAITEHLAKLIRDAEVTVLVREVHSEKVYVIGAVRKEGPITMQGPLTVLQALAEAGGFTDYAKKTRVYVLRQDHGQQIRLPFDYVSVIKGEHPEQNITLLPGDSVVVPQ